MLLCKEYADLAKMQAGTWGGVTRDPGPKHRPAVAVRKAGYCWHGLHDLREPGAVFVRRNGRKECMGCRADRAERHNERRRAERGEATTRVPVRPGAKPRKRAPRGPKWTPGARACTCGCGGTTRGGRYLPGHDSRHLAALRTDVRSRALTVEGALAEVAHSERLQAKLRAQLEARG
jgi:hypothetical protein